MEGELAEDVVLSWIARFADQGVDGITLCDTTGMGHPIQVQNLARVALARFLNLEFIVHSHNTRGMGLVNVGAAMEAGIRRLDVALEGIGGCPYAPGASGNVAAEDVVHMLDCSGYDTGISIDGVLAAAARLRDLVGHALPAQISTASPCLHRHPVPVDFDIIAARAKARPLAGATL